MNELDHERRCEMRSRLTKAAAATAAIAAFAFGERAAILESRTFRWRKRMLNLPMAGPMLRSIASKFRS